MRKKRMWGGEDLEWWKMKSKKKTEEKEERMK